MTTHEIIWTPETKEPKISHALAASSAFNLKLCHISLILFALILPTSLFNSVPPSLPLLLPPTLSLHPSLPLPLSLTDSFTGVT